MTMRFCPVKFMAVPDWFPYYMMVVFKVSRAMRMKHESQSREENTGIR